MKKKFLLSSLMIVLLAGTSHAATQLKKTICPSGCDYTSLESCMNANEKNLVTADQYFDVEISGTWSSADTTAVTVHNYTTDATRYIRIYTTGDARHAGIASSSKYALSNAGADGTGNISIQNNYVTIDGLQVTGMSNMGAVGIQSSNNNITVKNNIVYKTGPAALYGRGISMDGVYEGSNYIFNNLIYGINRSSGSDYGIRVQGFDGTSQYVYGNTIYGCDIGIYVAGNTNPNGTRLVNNLAIGNNTDYSLLGTLTTTTTNASEDTSSPNAALREVTVAFKNAAGYDFSLASTDTDAIDAGTNLGSSYNTDIVAAARGASWDIGAFEYISTAVRRFFMVN